MIIDFPDKLSFLFQPHRFKGAKGGRGSGKSWQFARALLIEGTRNPERILCAREVQKSIKDSVHRLLCDQIISLNLGHHYQPLETVIRGRNDTEILFTGLSTLTQDNLKSFEGVTKTWLEEAQNISKESWRILVPTIRKPGSEIWATYNPMLETDETHQRMVINPAPDTVCVEMNWRDNPWWTPELEAARLHDKATLPEVEYNWIWEGHCLPAVIGAIYASEIAKAVQGGRICHLPYDPSLKVHVVLDLGFGDGMSVGFYQRLKSEVRCIEHFYERYKRTDEIAALCRQRLYNYGTVFLPHDGFHEVRQGINDADVFRKFGFKVKPVPNIGREDGIRNTRNQFHKFWFDKMLTVGLIESLKRYARAETKHGGDGQPIHSEFSHDADMQRYASLVIDEMTNEDDYTEGPTLHAPQPHGTMGMC